MAWILSDVSVEKDTADKSAKSTIMTVKPTPVKMTGNASTARDFTFVSVPRVTREQTANMRSTSVNRSLAKMVALVQIN